MNNIPKKLNTKLIASLIVIQMFLITYCVVQNNTTSIDAQINFYTKNTSNIIYMNESDIGITSYNEQGMMYGCSLFNGCFSKSMNKIIVPEPITNIRNGDLIL
jgi:hypothetical protein